MPPNVATFDAARAARYDRDIPLAIPGYGVLHALTAMLCAELLAGPDRGAPNEAPNGAPGDAPGAGPPRLLLAGAGTGAELATLAVAGPTWHFVAADPSADMLEHLNVRAASLGARDRVVVHAGTVGTLPAGAAFDAATLLLVLHFLADDGSKLALLDDVAARLRPGAPLLLADMVGEPGTAAFELLLGTWEAHLRTAGGAPADRVREAAAAVRAQLHFVSEARLAELLGMAGFTPPTRYWQGLMAGAWVARRRS